MAALRTRQSRGLPVNCAGVKCEDSSLYDAACYHLGSWKAALRAAGVPMPRPRRWTKAELAAILRRLSGNGGFVGSGRIDAESRRIHRDIRGGIRAKFGTLRAARAQLGISSQRPPLLWTRERVIDEIRKCAQAGRVRHSPVERSNPRLLSAIDRRFGGWSAGLAAAGLTSATKWTRAEVLRTLRDAWGKRDIRVNALKATFGSGIYPVAVREFGSWQAALRAAGVPSWAYATRMSSRRALR